MGAFDHIRHVLVGVADMDHATRFFLEGLRLSVRHETVVGPETTARLFDMAGSEDARVVDLGPPRDGTGGLVRLVECSDLDEDPPPATVRHVGPYAMTFYARGVDAALERLAGLGFTDRSGPCTYELPGARFEVSEAIVAGPGGVAIALVEYLPGRHRCVLQDDEGLHTSEVVTVGQVLDDLDGVLPLYRDVLGGRVYLDGRFGGPSVEELSDLSPGDDMRVVMLRGPDSGNARFELIERPSATPAGQGPPRPRLGAGFGVIDVDEITRALEVTPGVTSVREVDDARTTVVRVAGGFTLEIWEDPR